MTDETQEKEVPAEGATAPEAEPAATEEILEPRSKYERIMMAAAEASRLNEETRRKGTKLDRKVTLEALKRVDEGKVKAVIGGRGLEAEPRAPARPEATVETLFLSPPLLADADAGDDDAAEPSEKDKD
jgi:DNA-directed RNA polymerase subunit K/omega